MSFGIFENLDSGAHSLTVTATANRRNFAAQVHQAYKDFGQFLASAESVTDLADRVRLVEAELREAGVNDPQSVLDGLAALAASDDTDDDSDSSDDDSDADPTDHDDSDVPDFVDTDDDDSKDRKESKLAVNEPLPNDPNNTTNAQATPAAPSMSPTNPTPAGIPGQAGGHPVVPRNVGVPGSAKTFGGPQNLNQPIGTPPVVPGGGPKTFGGPDRLNQPLPPVPSSGAAPFDFSGNQNTNVQQLQQRTYSKVLPVVPRIKK
jgi:hypothetical protein